MFRFKLGALLGFAAGWAIGSGKAAELLAQLRQSRAVEEPGAVASRVPRPLFDRSSESTAVSA